MDLVVIQVQALALAVLDLEFVRPVVLVDLERHTGIDTAQHADQAFLDAVAGGDLPSDVFLAVLGGVEVADLATVLPGQSEGGLLQASGNLQAVSREVFVGDAVFPEVVLQSATMGQTTQRAAEEETVEAAEDTADEGSEPGEEGEHGVHGVGVVLGSNPHWAGRKG